MNFFLKALLKKQLKNVPDDQLEMIITVFEKNPEFFKTIAAEIQTKVSSGMGQQEAAMAVMKSHEAELREITGKK